MLIFSDCFDSWGLCSVGAVFPHHHRVFFLLYSLSFWASVCESAISPNTIREESLGVRCVNLSLNSRQCLKAKILDTLGAVEVTEKGLQGARGHLICFIISVLLPGFLHSMTVPVPIHIWCTHYEFLPYFVSVPKKIKEKQKFCVHSHWVWGGRALKSESLISNNKPAIQNCHRDAT